MIKQLFGLAALVTAVAATNPANAADKVTIGAAGGINQLPSLVAEANGYFKDEGLDVTLKAVARGAVAIQGVAAGSMQFCESAHVPFMAAVSRGLPLVAVGVVTRGFLGKMVASVKNENLNTLAEFKGKHIGIQVGTGVQTIVLMLIAQEGMKPSDFKFTNLRVVDMPAAMAAPGNTFDAVIGWEPGMTRIVKSGHGKIVISSKKFDDMAHITYPFLLSTTQDYLKNHADVVQKVVNAYAKADKFIREHHDAAVKLYTDVVHKRGGKLTAETIRIMLFDMERFGGPAFTAADMKDFPQTRDFLIKIGKLKSLPPFSKIIDRGFGKKAEAMLKN